MQILNFVLKYYRNMEVYRSGHNGPDSKSGIRQRIVGSNPTASAKTAKNVIKTTFLVFFYAKNSQFYP